MSNYKTPGVYTEEISLLPPSVAQVSTAIPAFIGTTTAMRKKIARIRSLVEYEQYFGGPEAFPFEVNANPQKNSEGTVVAWTPELLDDKMLEPKKRNLMYYHLQMFFRNGGETCYILSVNAMDGNNLKAKHLNALRELEKIDEPTMIVFPDAPVLGGDAFPVYQQALIQCNRLKDRFSIFDVQETDAEDDVLNFRNMIGMNNLSYGAAYTPYLNTTLSFLYSEGDVIIKQNAPKFKLYSSEDQNNGLEIVSFGEETFEFVTMDSDFSLANNVLKINVSTAKKSASEIVDAWNRYTGQKGGLDLFSKGDGSHLYGNGDTITLVKDKPVKLYHLKNQKSPLYNATVKLLSTLRMKLPPSGTIAGVYSAVDSSRGVWKAPANISLNSVSGPTQIITDDKQENLNVDVDAGKSINAIRSFTGKGTMVWGSRTLDGNSNEWRYVPVRRLFIMIEESVNKACSFAVFEPNTAATWQKVKSMIDSFLYSLWQQGAMSGSSPAEAYFVNVGLGNTMTQMDVLEGRMIVEIGIAAVRPAEFIILRFSHFVQV